jgi:MATE family multidrug resistance protein
MVFFYSSHGNVNTIFIHHFLLKRHFRALGTALIVRLGHHLGANEPKKTKRCVIIATLLVLGCAFINASLMFVFRTTIASYFTTEHEVLASIDALMRIASLCQFVTVSPVLSLFNMYLCFMVRVLVSSFHVH